MSLNNTPPVYTQQRKSNKRKRKKCCVCVCVCIACKAHVVAFTSYSNIHLRKGCRNTSKLFKQGDKLSTNYSIYFTYTRREERISKILDFSPFPYMRSFSPAT